MLRYKQRNPFSRHPLVPCAFRVHYRDGAMGANSQAIHPRPVARIGHGRKAKISLFELFLQRLPGSLADFGCTAIRTGTQKHMAVILADAEPLGNTLKWFVGVFHRLTRKRRSWRTISANNNTDDVEAANASHSVTVSG